MSSSDDVTLSGAATCSFVCDVCDDVDDDDVELVRSSWSQTVDDVTTDELSEESGNET